ncbi:MAG: ABC-three component system middle component 1 [bacterium]
MSMKNFLAKILTDNGFQETKPEAESETDSKKDFLFKHEEHDEEYYFLSEYTAKELNDYFLDSDRTKSFFDYLEGSQKEHPNVKKNSSQIIFVNVDSLVDDFKILKNQIYRIEEDEFFLKKYILLYTSEALEVLKTLSINKLQERLYNLSSFDNFFTGGLDQPNNIDPEYFLLTQLFIKLPFIKLSEVQKDFEPLDEIINYQLSENNLDDFNRRLFIEDKESPCKELNSLELEDMKNLSNIMIDEKLDSIITKLGLIEHES